MNRQEIFRAVIMTICSTSHLAHVFEREEHQMKRLVRDIKVSLGTELLLDFSELVNIIPEERGIILIQCRDEPSRGIHLPINAIERRLCNSQFLWAEKNYILDICNGHESILPHSPLPAEALLLRWAELLAKASLALPGNNSVPADKNCRATAEQLLTAFSHQADHSKVRQSSPRDFVNLHWKGCQASLERTFVNAINDPELREYILGLDRCRPKQLKGPRKIPKKTA